MCPWPSASERSEFYHRHRQTLTDALTSVFVACEINYLCVHKKLRSKRLAPVLIKEVTRRVHLEGIFQAIYTAGVVVPTPVSTCQYHHRALNTTKLVDIHFTSVPRHMSLARLINYNRVPDKTTLPIREMEEKDVEQVADLFARFMLRYDMVPTMTFDDVRHQFLSGNGTGKLGDGGPGRRERQVTWCYVVEVVFLLNLAFNDAFDTHTSGSTNPPSH